MRTSPLARASDQLGHSKVSMTQDRYLGRRLTDRQTSEVLDDMFEDPEEGAKRPEADPDARSGADGSKRSQ
jgi:hypothetical protein